MEMHGPTIKPEDARGVYPILLALQNSLAISLHRVRCNGQYLNLCKMGISRSLRTTV